MAIPVRTNLPGRRVFRTAINLNKSNASLHETTRPQALKSERSCFGVVDVVEFQNALALATHVGDFGSTQLKPGRHFIGFDACFQFAVGLA